MIVIIKGCTLSLKAPKAHIGDVLRFTLCRTTKTLSLSINGKEAGPIFTDLLDECFYPTGEVYCEYYNYYY